MSASHSGSRFAVAAILLAAIALGATGCNPFGGNFTLNIYIPLGLDSSTGLLDLFGWGQDQGGTIIPPDVL